MLVLTAGEKPVYVCVCVLYCLWLLAPSLWPCSSWGGGAGRRGFWLWRASAKALHTSVSVFSAEKPMKFEPRLHQSCDIYVYLFYLEPFWIIFYKNRLCLVFGQRTFGLRFLSTDAESTAAETSWPQQGQGSRVLAQIGISSEVLWQVERRPVDGSGKFLQQSSSKIWHFNCQKFPRN